MYYLIQDNKVVGSSDREVGIPQGMSLVKSELDRDPEAVYYNGTDIVLKSPQPTIKSLWDSEQNIWYEPVSKITSAPQPPVTANEVALAVKEHLTTIDPILAETIAWIVARITGAKAYEENQVAVITKLIFPEDD